MQFLHTFLIVFHKNCLIQNYAKINIKIVINVFISCQTSTPEGGTWVPPSTGGHCRVSSVITLSPLQVINTHYIFVMVTICGLDIQY